MIKLRTVYPYGLNNRLGKNLDQRETEDTVYKEFTRRKRKRKRRFRKRKIPWITADELYKEIYNLFKKDVNVSEISDEDDLILLDIHKLFIEQHYVITIEEINMLLNSCMEDENNWDHFPRN